ncbi:MAG TPA: cobyric acid synthase [Candidatus Binataceae bacterium]|nr:cobyric acid synthase [Candidatus Binataceae bacterium]
MPACTLMVQGTASSVGKSIFVTALCRIFRQRGIRVAPFKAQNMSLNSFVTPDGKEIGRAQAVQAEASGIAPTAEMNPILLKPEGGGRSQIVMLGKPVGTLKFGDDDDRLSELRAVVAQSLARLRENYELIVIEGAGSPVEINLKARDVVNMHVARLADAPVIMLGDIDRGGVFAQFVGTIELLEPDERARVAALAINKFRGDIGLLQSGLDFIVRRVNTPMLGVIPFIERLRIADEDAVAIEERRYRTDASSAELRIAIVRYPRISNFDDFQPLEHEPGVDVRFVDAPHELANADLVILPGSKSTVADLEWLRQSGIDRVVLERARRGDPILGVCGGYQMLGKSIEDPDGVESPRPSTPGLGLLPVCTRFARDKLTAQVRARVNQDCFVAHASSEELSAYEIHMGRAEPIGDSAAPFEILSRNRQAESAFDGAISENRAVVGTSLHGLFENDWLRASMLRSLRGRRDLADPVVAAPPFSRENEYDRLAAIVRENIDLGLLERLAGFALS